MSDTAQQRVRQRQKQQRQILAMLGIEQWVQPTSPTMPMHQIAEVATAAHIAMPTELEASAPAATVASPAEVQSEYEARDDSGQPQIEKIHGEHNHQAVPPVTRAASAVDDSHDAYSEHDSAGADYFEMPEPEMQAGRVFSLDSIDEPSAADTSETINIDANREAVVAPFTLQGGRYGNWIVLVDMQALDSDRQKLWQNMVQALSLSCETSSFPICAGMDSAELANASLAGYLFKIGRRDDLSVAALTALPEHLTHPNLTAVPTLDAMLADASLKREFWQQLSETAVTRPE